MASLLQMMEDYTSNSEIIALIELACDACEAELRERSGLEMTWRAVVPALDMTGAASELRSLWVFASSPGGRATLTSTRTRRNIRAPGAGEAA